EVHYHVAQGRLFQLNLALPDRVKDARNWQVEDVKLEPDSLQGTPSPRSVRVSEARSREYLVVDLERALTPQTSAKLTVRLRSTVGEGVPAAGQTTPFP